MGAQYIDVLNLDSLITKNFFFLALNNYSYLIYLGIFKQFVGGQLSKIGIPNDECTDENTCMGQLMLNMAIIFVGLQFVSQFQNVLVPMVIQWIKRFIFARRKALKESKKRLSEQKESRKLFKSKDANSENDSQNPKAGDNSKKNDHQIIPLVQSVQDYISDTFQYVNDSILNEWSFKDEIGPKAIQFGFITFFSIGFPLAPLFAFLSASVEVRLGAYRLLVESQRPFSTRGKGIGGWERLLVYLAHGSVLINALLIAFTSKYAEKYYWERFSASDSLFSPLTAKLLFIIIFEHVVAVVVVIQVLLDYL